MARRESGDWVYGLHAVGALLRRHPEHIIRLYFQEGREDSRLRRLEESAAGLGIARETRPRSDLDRWLDGAAHQGVAARCKPFRRERDEGYLDRLLEGLDHPPLLLVLDAVTDPHNLGACLRSAEAAGADAVVVPKDKSARVTATVRKVSSGAAEMVPVVAVTNLARTLDRLKQKGVWVRGLAGEAGTSLHHADLTGPLALVLGAEGSGLRRLTREHCDELLRIPMAGEIGSLNVSVSAGVCLFEALRQRGPRHDEEPTRQ